MPQNLLRSFGAGQSVRSNATQGADTFVQNNQKAGKNNLHGLAQAFGLGSNVLEAQTAYISQEAKKEAQTAYAKYGKEIGKAGREGKIAHFDNPIFQGQLSKMKGNRASISYNEHLREAYETLPAKEKMRPEEFLQFEEDQRSEFLEAMRTQQFEEQGGKDNFDDDYILAFQSGANQHVNNLGQSHAAKQQQFLQDEHKEELYQGTLNTINNAIIYPLQEGGDIDAIGAVGQINDFIKDSYNSGLEGRHIRQMVSEALISVAGENDNDALVEIAKGVKVGTANLFDNSEHRDQFVAAIKRGKAQTDLKTRRKEKEQEQAVQEAYKGSRIEMTQRLRDNPDASIEDILDRHPSKYQDLIKLQDAFNKPIKTNPSTFLSLDKDFRAGNLSVEDVHQAFADEKISQNDMNKMLGKVDSREQAYAKSQQAQGASFDKEIDASIKDFTSVMKGTFKQGMMEKYNPTNALSIEKYSDSFEELLYQKINAGEVNNSLELDEAASEIRKRIFDSNPKLTKSDQSTNNASLEGILAIEKEKKMTNTINDVSQLKGYSETTTEKMKGWSTGKLIIDSPERERDVIDDYKQTINSDIPLPITISTMFAEYGIDPREPQEVKAFLIMQRILKEGQQSE